MLPDSDEVNLSSIELQILSELDRYMEFSKFVTLHLTLKCFHSVEMLFASDRCQLNKFCFSFIILVDNLDSFDSTVWNIERKRLS